jgi:hypothetical protein
MQYQHNNCMAECRHGRILAIQRVTIAGKEYTFLKCDWFSKPTKEQIKAYRLRNSILGPDDVTQTFFTFNPFVDPLAYEKAKEPYILANRVEQQVVIAPHPCMETAVILDPTADFFESLRKTEKAKRA